MSGASNGGSDLITRRIGRALITAREAARWNSGRAMTEKDALRFHSGLITVIAVLEGHLDDYLAGQETDDGL